MSNPWEKIHRLESQLRHYRSRVDTIPRLQALQHGAAQVPREYLDALDSLHAVAHSAPPSDDAGSSTPTHESRAPSYNPAALGMLNREQAHLKHRAAELNGRLNRLA